jgi:hypothetical protein
MDSRIIVGAPVFLEPTGNGARRWDGKPEQYEIAAIGSKYFTTKTDRWEGPRFDKNTLSYPDFQKGNSGYILYFSEQEFMDEMERRKLLRGIRDLFSYRGNDNSYSLSQLRRINDILQEGKE